MAAPVPCAICGVTKHTTAAHEAAFDSVDEFREEDAGGGIPVVFYDFEEAARFEAFAARKRLAAAVARKLAAPARATPPDANGTPARRRGNAREAAAILGITVAALRKRVQRGELPRGAIVYRGRRRYEFILDRLAG